MSTDYTASIKYFVLFLEMAGQKSFSSILTFKYVETLFLSAWKTPHQLSQWWVLVSEHTKSLPCGATSPSTARVG